MVHPLKPSIPRDGIPLAALCHQSPSQWQDILADLYKGWLDGFPYHLFSHAGIG
jgi:hypothetical protein